MGHPLLLEPELAPQADEALIWNQQSWAYWKYGFVPTVSTLKWLEPRHLPIVCDRWSRDKTDDLQFAFFNGAGYSSWENVWGIWNGLTDRDAEALRRMAFLERQFASFLTSSKWEPHTPTLQYGVYASKWPRVEQNTLWTVVNRNEFDVKGQQISIPYQAGSRYYDLWHGTELSPSIEKDHAILSFDLEAHGFGAVLGVSAHGSAPEALPSVLQTMHTATAKPLAEFSHQWHVLTQSLVPITETKWDAQRGADAVRVPGGEFDFAVHGIEIEGGDSNGVDVQYPWEDSPRRQHRRHMQIHTFFLDRYPVTKGQFARFLDETQYHPADDHNFLRDWQGGRPKPGSERQPVTWVSLDDARAYAKWAGARLPHEWEWQYAAQGSDGRAYPWGNEWKDSAVPKRETGRALTSPSPVGTHPEGASAFGVEDMVGNVWQWTDEYQDEHTRAAVLRGGSYYQPGGAIWYFPQAYRLDEHGKYLLMAPAKDRSGTVGFRCAQDAE